MLGAPKKVLRLRAALVSILQKLHQNFVRSPHDLIGLEHFIGHVEVQVSADHLANVILDQLVPVFLGDVIDPAPPSSCWYSGQG